MQLKLQEGLGGGAPLAGPDAQQPPKKGLGKKAGLGLGRATPLSSISGPTYVTAQLLVQQIAYKLSDKIFSYSPETFDLDAAVREWAAAGESNIHGYATSVVPLQTRTGAGAFALGYIFSEDFDQSKRAVPQSLLAPSLSLRNLRSALDQLSLLYGAASPFVAHVAAADYSAQSGLVAEYEPALQLAEELGLALVSSASAYEAQHMSLFATALAAVLPTLHVYDGLRVSRETLRVVDALSETGIADLYGSLARQAGALSRQRLDGAGKALELLRAFNSELGTSYEPFEYHGHGEATTVFVVFGSAESQLARQVVARLAARGDRVGALCVRLYRPFIEEAFLRSLPATTREVAVLGQVRDAAAVDDASVRSILFSDVITAVSFSDAWPQVPRVVDVKYASSEALTPAFVASVFAKVVAGGADAADAPAPTLAGQAEQYTFWELDDSVSVGSPAAIGGLLAKESTNNVYVHEAHDNLIQGGVVRTDVRNSKRAIEAPYPVDQADIAFVGDEKLLKEIAILDSVKADGKVIVRLAGFKDEDVDKRIPDWTKKQLAAKRAQLFVLDPSAGPPALEDEAQLLVELAFLQVAAKPGLATPEQLAKLTWLVDSEDQEAAAALLQQGVDALAQSLRQLELPAAWADLAVDGSVAAPTRQDIKQNSFAAFGKESGTETEASAAEVGGWTAAAKGLAFREAYGTRAGLRPDLATKTYTIRVKENRRLTPTTYDRNVFHIEFDLGESGLTYNIGEALGIHADNDPAQVERFMALYGLDGQDVVAVPSREDAAVLETRTVYQALLQNLDILGKPPKRFYEALAEFAADEAERTQLAALGGPAGAAEFKRRSEEDAVTYADVLEEFASARPSLGELARLVAPLKRREYSIASAQAVTPTAVSLMIVVVDWVDGRGRTRFGQASRYLSELAPGARVVASVKPSVMKLPTRDSAPLILAGLGTGLAPFRAFVQYRAMQKAQGKDIGAILLYMGSRHQREEYLYGEEWEAYLDAGVVTLLGAAFSRDQPQKIYIQDRMRQTMADIVDAYIRNEGSFYLCGPTWPVPDVTAVLEEAIAAEAKAASRKVDPRKEIERLKEDGRYVLEVY